MDINRLLKKKCKALEEKNSTLLATICTELAKCYVEVNQYDSAISEYKIVSKIYLETNKKLEYATVNRGIGEAYMGLNQFKQARKYFHIFLDGALQSGNKLEEQRALATLGHGYLTSYLNDVDNEDMKKMLPLAYSYFKQSLDVCDNLHELVSEIERADMSARLLCNMGLVQDALGRNDLANEMISKSIFICKANSIYEQLQRSHIALGSLYEKNKELDSALEQYGLAVEVTGVQKDPYGLLVEALTGKAEVLLKIGDIRSAKTTMLKAYKKPALNVDNKNILENKLRVVASMAYAEDKLMLTNDDNFTELKSLYEQLGDGACYLKLYERGLEYYTKMLHATEKSGPSDSDLSKCYYSLAETYKDMNQYERAIHFYEVDLKLPKETYKDKVNSLIKIADLREKMSCNLDCTEDAYQQAINLCKKMCSYREEVKITRLYIAFLRRQGQNCKAFELEEGLNEDDSTSDNLSGDSSEDDTVPPIGAEINLNELTDDESGKSSSDNSPKIGKRRSRRFKNKTIVKRNAKGETALHVACISGKLDVVRHLIDTGHPHNIRDNCGWLPLHEACSWGYYDIVECLLQKGSAPHINDRGGALCNGVTPLYDAASNGHLEIIQLLLDKGASAVVRTDAGDTILDALELWYTNNKPLDEDIELQYSNLANRLKNALERIGCEQLNKASTKRRSNEKIRCHQSSLRTADGACTSSNSDKVEMSVDSVNYYQERNKRSRSPQNNLPSLVSENETVDEWLENDIERKSKSRRLSMSLIRTSSRKEHSSSNLAKPVQGLNGQKTPAKYNNDTSIECIDRANDDGLQYDCSLRISEGSKINDSAQKRTSKKKRNYQVSLSNFLQQSETIKADSTSDMRNSTTLNSINTTDLQLKESVRPSLIIDVKIENNVFRIPVPFTNSETQTVKWLSSEAANRYARRELITPIIELYSPNGALLCDDDLLNTLFPPGTTLSEPLTARVLQWVLPSMSERYKESCADHNEIPNTNLLNLMTSTSNGIINVMDLGLAPNALKPFCKSLSKEAYLTELNLSGNFFNLETISLLFSGTEMSNLKILKLRSIALTSKMLTSFSKYIQEDKMNKIMHLDLSENYLCDESYACLTTITHHLRLEYLNLSCNNFGSSTNIIDSNQLHLHLENVEHLDISSNMLDNLMIINIMQRANSSVLKHINISKNKASNGLLHQLLDVFSNHFENNLVLNEIKLSHCLVDDSELFEMLLLCGKLEILDLSYNPLTSISLKRLLQLPKCTTLLLHGCNTIFDNVELNPIEKLQPTHLKSLTLSADFTIYTITINSLVSMWSILHGNEASIQKSTHLLRLSTL